MQKAFPTTGVIHITEMCTHKCRCCYAGKGLGLQKEADIHTLYKIIDKLDNIGVSNVCLLGGDPVKYPSIINLLKYIKNNSSIKNTVMSNTFEPSSGSFEELCKFVDSVETTIHGPNASVHDSFCDVNGAYDNLVEKFHVFSSNDIVAGIAVNITPTTYDKIFDTIKNFNDKTANSLSYVIVQRIIPSGNAENGQDHLLKKSHINSAMQQIDEVYNKLKIKISIEDPFPLCIVDENFHKYMHRCEWGITKFSLNANGEFSRCGATPNQVLGNILSDNFEDVWQSSLQLNDFRNLTYLNNKCKDCSNKTICGGGCPISNIVNTLSVDYLIGGNSI
jgi:radical SAM protein with 4Fe4S-binding SPASM domain